MHSTRENVHHRMLSNLGTCRYSYPARSSKGKTGGPRVAMRKAHMEVEGAEITVHGCWIIFAANLFAVEEGEGSVRDCLANHT